MALAAYPRPVREIHQIEFSTRCNLRCHYCPHFPELPRTKEDMDDDTFAAAMDLVGYYCKRGTQGELSLTGIGEAMLHPKFLSMATTARAVIGPKRPLVVTTNGLLLDEDMCRALAELDPKPYVFVSLHRPEKAGLAIQMAKKYGIFADHNNAFATSAFNWAGTQKNWYVTAPKIECEYLRTGWAVILVDGRIATCCLDADGSSVVGHVRDDPNSLKLKPWGDEKKGCSACHMVVP